jgi:hypothetical protein
MHTVREKQLGVDPAQSPSFIVLRVRSDPAGGEIGLRGTDGGEPEKNRMSKPFASASEWLAVVAVDDAGDLGAGRDWLEPDP